ncbi:MAG TPA: cobalamin-binding protein [Eubacteriaceae bacterium]|nr:cobalamin-binding protein [Eubacteriaceae bacterium]
MSIAEMIANLEDENAVAEVQKQLEDGVAPTEILAACQEGMNLVGQKFEDGEYYVSDLMMSGSIFKQVNDILLPHLKSADEKSLGKVVLGTVEGDIHDIGKDLVKVMLGASSFEVIDVGVDANKDVFVQALKDNPDAKILALSCLLTTCYDALKDTIDAVKSEGLNDVKIMIGGGPVDEGVVEFSGADTYGTSAQHAVTIAKELM